MSGRKYKKIGEHTWETYISEIGLQLILEFPENNDKQKEIEEKIKERLSKVYIDSQTKSNS